MSFKAMGWQSGTILAICSAFGLLGETSLPAAETKVAVTISGGHEIGPKDFGRPIPLIAAALKVKPETFREAFSGVTPSRQGPPSREEAQKNKVALMRVLAPHGITNERLDEVSNYYRYQPQRGELWPTMPAKAHAIVENGKVVKVVITEAGSGYCSVPKISVAGFETTQFQAELGFSDKFKQNGRLTSITVKP